MNTLYLTRRNLVTLLNKLDDPNSSRTIIKVDVDHQKYPIGEPTKVTAVEDDDYYTDREPGEVHPAHEPTTGSWILASDVDRMARELDVAMNGEEGAARHPKLCDVVAQAKNILQK